MAYNGLYSKLFKIVFGQGARAPLVVCALSFMMFQSYNYFYDHSLSFACSRRAIVSKWWMQCALSTCNLPFWSLSRNECSWMTDSPDHGCNAVKQTKIIINNHEKIDFLENWLIRKMIVLNELNQAKYCLPSYMCAPRRAFVCWDTSLNQWNLLFLAHLSQRLTRWAYRIAMIWHPSVRPLSTISKVFFFETAWPIK